MLSSANLLALDSELSSRSFLFGASICVDSLDEKLLLRVVESLKSALSDFVDVELLPVNPSPLLQDYILCHYASDEIVLSMAYCERVSTVPPIPACDAGLPVPRPLEAPAAGAAQSPPAARRSDVPREGGTLFRARSPQKHASLAQLRSYVGAFHASAAFSLDLFMDSDANARFYADYNAFRKSQASGKEAACAASIRTHLFTLEVEQFVCFKILSDLLSGRWVVPVRVRRRSHAQIPRYCRPEAWEFEQMLKVATGKVPTFRRCRVSLQFEVKSLETEGKIVLASEQSVLKKYGSLKRFEYASPWHDEDCKEKNKVGQRDGL